jgi:hypothetical protein
MLVCRWLKSKYSLKMQALRSTEISGTITHRQSVTDYKTGIFRSFVLVMSFTTVNFSQVYAVCCLYHSSSKSPFARQTADYNGHEPFTKKHVTGCSQSAGSEIYTTHGIPSASPTVRFKTTRTLVSGYVRFISLCDQM